MSLTLRVPMKRKKVKPRKETFNLRNQMCQENFHIFTSNFPKFETCLQNEGKTLTERGETWIKYIRNAICRNFRKTRIKIDSIDKDIQPLVDKRCKLKERICQSQQISKEDEDNLETLEDEIKNKISEKKSKKILDQLNQLQENNSLNRINMWKLKKSICQEAADPPTAKYNIQGELVTDEDKLLELYKDTYKTRLRNRKMKPEYKLIGYLNTVLFNIRVGLSKSKKSGPWLAEQLLKVLTSLKRNKCSDPLDMSYELFMSGVIGSNLFNSLLIFLNETKEKCEIIDSLQLADITSKFKKKSSRLSLDNQRGIFSVVKIRSILDKLLYEDIYPEVDEKMSDSNVGARKKRSIRDNLFVLYSVMGDALDSGIDLEVAYYDLAKCFDSMWWEGTSNDLWDKNVTDDKFALICALNQQCNVSVKTTVGQTDRFELRKIEMQGTVNSPLKCTVQMDLIGLDMYTTNDGLHMYKDLVAVPALGMVDDVVAFNRCGADAIISNAVINNKIESKRLEFGPSKCVQMHVGGKPNMCPQLYVHDVPMKSVSSQVYLGDTVSSTLNNNLNIKNRCNRSIGTISEIMTILNDISHGHYYFTIGLIMRESILVSKLLLNSEVWVNLTNQQVSQLEQADLCFQRKLLNCHSKTNIEIIYSELGTSPLQLTLRKRRLMYLWHIVNRNETELIHRVYNAQRFKPSKSDWLKMVHQDKIVLGINYSDDELKLLTKEYFKTFLNNKVKTARREYLKSLQLNKSKSKYIQFKDDPEPYINDPRFTKVQVQLLFSLRSRTYNCKDNFRVHYGANILCELCHLSPCKQSHILSCSILLQNANISQNILSNISHEMIYGTVNQQLEFVNVFEKLSIVRSNLLKNIAK